MSSKYPPKTPQTYKTVLPADIDFEFVSARTIFPYTLTPMIGDRYYRQTVFLNNEEIFFNEYITGTSGHSGRDIGLTTKLKIGTYTINYEFGTCEKTWDGMSYDRVTYAIYNISVVENKRPLKKWTITSVINRLLDVCEPIRKGEKPRFRLQGMKADGTFEEGSQADKFDKILAPQFSINSLITQ